MRRKINEEITANEIRSIVSSQLDSFIKERDFKKRVREITADVLEDLFKEMWHKKSFWKGGLKNG